MITYCQIMSAAWKLASDFNTNYPVGTAVKYSGKDYVTAQAAYVLTNGEPVVTLSTIDYPVKISELLLPVSP